MLRNGNFGGGVIVFREILEKWRGEGMPGLAMTTNAATSGTRA